MDSNSINDKKEVVYITSCETKTFVPIITLNDSYIPINFSVSNVPLSEKNSITLKLNDTVAYINLLTRLEFLDHVTSQLYSYVNRVKKMYTQTKDKILYISIPLISSNKFEATWLPKGTKSSAPYAELDIVNDKWGTVTGRAFLSGYSPNIILGNIILINTVASDLVKYDLHTDKKVELPNFNEYSLNINGKVNPKICEYCKFKDKLVNNICVFEPAHKLLCLRHITFSKEEDTVKVNVLKTDVLDKLEELDW